MGSSIRLLSDRRGGLGQNGAALAVAAAVLFAIVVVETSAPAVAAECRGWADIPFWFDDNEEVQGDRCSCSIGARLNPVRCESSNYDANTDG